jgi:hypothetical protein
MLSVIYLTAGQRFSFSRRLPAVKLIALLNHPPILRKEHDNLLREVLRRESSVAVLRS